MFGTATIHDRPPLPVSSLSRPSRRQDEAESAFARLSDRAGERAAERAIGDTAAAPHDWLGAGACQSFAANSEIFAQGDRVEKVCRVLSGAVRATRLLADGRRQITSFYLPGEVFGLEASMNCGYTAEAVGATTLQIVRRASLLERARGDAQVSGALLQATASALEAAQQHMTALGRRTALERVAGFLLDLRARIASGTARPGEILSLPMCRQDIADHLGLTIETVSRSMTQLESETLIALPSARRVVLSDPQGLADLLQ